MIYLLAKMVINMELTRKELELVDRGYSKEELEELVSYTDEYVDKISDNIVENISVGCTKSDKPTAIFIGGQPGCGKSTSLRTIKTNWIDNNVICIIGLDNYRTYHPNYKKMEQVINDTWKDKEDADNKSRGNDIAILTGEFAGEVTDTVIRKLSDDNYNIAIEWGMRSPLVPLEMMEMLHDKGYKVIVKFIIVDKETSREACKLRDDVMNNHNIILRRIPTSFHENAVNTLPASAEQIYIEGYLNKKIIDEFYLVDRNSNILWDSSSDKKLIDTYNYYLNNKTEPYVNNPKYSELSYIEETKYYQ